jgi:Zn-dependent membrane protease YugP
VHIIIIILLVIGLILGPGIWVRMVMKRYREPVDRYDLSGAQAARKLLDAHELQNVPVEMTEAGDHYDPIEKVLRLSPAHHDGHSLAAIVVAAHETGHAVQDSSGYKPLAMRTRLVRWVGPLEKLGAGLLMSAPLIMGLTRVPYAGALFLLGGFLSLGSAVVVHMLTLPTEIDASFNRALPMLADHDALIEGDEPHARRLLKAAAMTYVSASLMSLLNIARWWAILRR